MRLGKKTISGRTLNSYSRPRKDTPASFQVVIVTFQASGELRMGGRRPFGVAIRMMTTQAVLILCYVLMDIGHGFNGRAVHAQIMAIGAAAKNRQHGTENCDFYHIFHCFTSRIRLSLRQVTTSAVSAISMS